MSKKYQIVFTGKLAGEKKRTAAVASLAKVFNLSPGKVERLLADPPVVLKNDLDPSAAKKYREVFENAGLVCITRPTPDRSETSSSQDSRKKKTAPTPDKPEKQTRDTPDGELAGFSEKTNESEEKKEDEDWNGDKNSGDRHDLILLGPASEKTGRDVLKVALAGIFNTDLSQIEQLLSSLPRVVKRNTDLETATKWRAVLEEAGAHCHIREHKREKHSSESTARAPTGDTVSKPSDFNGGSTCPRCNHAMGAGPRCMYCGFDTKSGKKDLPPPTVINTISRSAKNVTRDTGERDLDLSSLPIQAGDKYFRDKKGANKKTKLMNAALMLTLLMLVVVGISHFLFQDLQSGIDRIDRASDTELSSPGSTRGNTLSEAKKRPEFSANETDLEKILQRAFAGEDLSEIQELDLSGANISDLEPLRRMTGLKTLNLSSTKVVDIGPLADLAQLNRLYLKDTAIDDISAISDLFKLTVLDLGGTQVSDIGSLRWLTELTRLNLSGTLVDDISPISELYELSYLDISHTSVTNLKPIRSLFHLTMLDITGTPVDSLRLLSGHPAIARLSISKTNVSDIDPLEKVEKLSFLELGKNQVPEDQLRNLKIAHPGLRVQFQKE